MLTNAEIFKKLGVTTKILKTREEIKRDVPRWQGADFYVGIYDKEGMRIHAAFYNAPDDYEYIINHCVQIEKLPNWEFRIKLVKTLLKQFPELRVVLDEPNSN